MSDFKFKESDGWKRNWERMKAEIAELKTVLKEQDGSHARYINFFVEGCRHAPYTFGHVIAVLLPALVIVSVWGWVQ